MEVVKEDGDEIQWGAGADRMKKCGDAVEQASGRAGEHEHEHEKAWLLNGLKAHRNQIRGWGILVSRKPSSGDLNSCRSIRLPVGQPSAWY